MKTTPVISLVACAGLLLSGCQSNKKNFAAPPIYTRGTSSVAVANPKDKNHPDSKMPPQGIIHAVWAQGSPILPVKWYVDGKDAGTVAGSKAVALPPWSQTTQGPPPIGKYWVHFYNVQTGSAFPENGKAIPVELSVAKPSATIHVTASTKVPKKSGSDNNAVVLGAYTYGTNNSGKIHAVLNNMLNSNGTPICSQNGNLVDWYQDGNKVGLIPSSGDSTASNLIRTPHGVYCYNHNDNTFFPIPDLVVNLQQYPGPMEGKVKVCVKP